MAEWLYFIHPPREDFGATMTDEESAAWQEHFTRLRNLVDSGVVILAGPTLGAINTGVVIFEARDEEAARAIMDADPAIAGGYADAELHPFRVSLLRGRTDRA